MSEEEKRLLEKQLWGVANVLRGKMHADEYKNYILGFIFYKYLSEKLERYVNEKLLAGEKFTFSELKENTKDGKEDLEHIKAASLEHLGFFLRPSELFSILVKRGKGEEGKNTFILEDLKKILNAIEKTSAGTESEDDFKGLFDDVDLTSSKLGSSENKKNDVIIEVLSLLRGIDFKLEDSKSDLLGDAYEYLIGEFAAGAGKKGGEFYTPSQVSRLLAQIVSVDKKRVRSVYDPTCGSGSLLLRIKDYVEVGDYYGQELNPTTYNLARMNMILHGVHFDKFKIRQGDTLTEDMHPDLKAEVVIANPPFSAKWKGDQDPQLVHDDRFSQYGRLAPKGAADYAFVTHMLYHLADNGTMAIVLPHGVLFRPDAEEQIRKYIVEKQNYLDAVIGLPANLFYGTTIPATILVFKKCRRDGENVFFIDASKDFEKGKNQNKLTDENIKKIFNTYKLRKEISKYSHKASLAEIKAKEYKLNILRYVDTQENEENIDINGVAKQLVDNKELENNALEKIIIFCKELGIPVPDGNNTYLLKKYKKGLVQTLFLQKVRFKADDGKSYPEWQEQQLKDVLSERKVRNSSNTYNEVFSVAKEKGVINQIEHLGRSFAAENLSNYKVVFPGDIIYTKSPTAGFPYGIIKQNKLDRTGLVSTLYAVYTPTNKYIGNLLHEYFLSPINTYNYLVPLVQKGAKNTINIGNDDFLKGTKVIFPKSEEEQQKIVTLLALVDELISLKERRVEAIEKT